MVLAKIVDNVLSKNSIAVDPKKYNYDTVDRK